jgi:hypothetical protein
MLASDARSALPCGRGSCGVAVLDVHHFAHLAKLGHALKKDHLHVLCSLLHGIGQQGEEAGALDGLRQFTLLLGRDCGDAGRDDLAALEM